MQHLLSLREAANLLGLSVACLRAWRRSGRLSILKVGRRVLVEPETVEYLIAAGRRPSLPPREHRRRRRAAVQTRAEAR